MRARGRQKKSVIPVVGGWIRVRKKDGVRIFSRYFFIVFLNSPHQETPKNVMKTKSKEIGFGFLVELFSTPFFV
jgi:hypothetical protein